MPNATTVRGDIVQRAIMAVQGAVMYNAIVWAARGRCGKMVLLK
jgi:hypothetical protein